MIRRFLPLCLLAIGCLVSGWVHAEDKSVPAMAVVPDDAILVLRVAEPKALIERAYDPRIVAFVESLPPYKEAMAKPEMTEALKIVKFFESKYNAKLPELLGKLVGGGITLAVGPNESNLLIVDAENAEMLAEIHDFFRTIAKEEARKQGDPTRVASAEYRGVEGWKFGPGDSHVIIGSRLLFSNKPETIKAAIDRQLDYSGDTAKASRLQTLIASQASNQHHVTLFADMKVLKQVPGFGQGLNQDDNPLTRLLFAPFLAALQDATWVTAGANLTNEDLAIDVAADRASAEATALNSFALPVEGGKGAMPNLTVPGQIAAISLYRDLHEFYSRKDELFPDRTSGLIFFENMMGIFFSGKDLTNEVLAETLPDMRVVVAEQRYDEKTGTPAMKLPGFAVVLQLRDPAKFQEVMDEAWQKAIGLVNFTRGQQGPARVDHPEASPNHNGIDYTSSYFSVAGEEDKNAVDIRFNFQPALAVVGDRLIMSSSDALTRVGLYPLAARPGARPIFLFQVHPHSDQRQYRLLQQAPPADPAWPPAAQLCPSQSRTTS